MPDYQSKLVDLSFQCHGTTEEDEEVRDHKLWFQSLVRGFLDRRSTCRKTGKLERRASYWWLRCLHAMLVRMCGFGLEAFCSDATITAITALGCLLHGVWHIAKAYV